MKEYRTSKFKKNVILSKSWYLFRWEIAAIVFLALLVALLNQIPSWVVKPLEDGRIDPILSYPLRDNIVYSSIATFLTIGIVIFVGVFSEIGQFSGKFGSAILILVPSFVWLLSDRSNNLIQEVLSMSSMLGTIIFWAVVTIAIAFVVMALAKQILASLSLATRVQLRIEFIFNYLNRMIIVFINILMVLLLGYVLINYGVFALHLADNSIQTQRDNPGIGTYNLHSESFTTYIAVITVVFGLMMVVIGLTNTFTSGALKGNEDWAAEINKADSAAKRALKEQVSIKQKRLEKERMGGNNYG